MGHLSSIVGVNIFNQIQQDFARLKTNTVCDLNVDYLKPRFKTDLKLKILSTFIIQTIFYTQEFELHK